MTTNPVDPDGPGGTDRGAAPRGAWRRSPVVVSVTAAVLLAGGGGTYLAVAASGDAQRDRGEGVTAPGDDAAPPPLALDGPGGDTGGEPGIAPGEPDPGGPLYRARGELPRGPGTAAVHRPDAEVTAGEVRRLAEALGVPGTPRLSGETWRVGTPKDGSGPSLQAARDGGGTWTFQRYAAGPDGCGTTATCADGGADRTSVDTAPIGERAAKSAAAPVLKALGQDDAKLDARQVMGSARVVNAAPRVGGLPTFGWSTGVQVGPTGEVVRASGHLGEPRAGDRYPVISARKALELLNQQGGGRVGIGGCADPVPHQDDPSVACGDGGAAKAREPLTVTGAEFGLAVRLADSRPALVPSWLFEVRPKGAGEPYTVTYPAVDPRHLADPGKSGGEEKPDGARTTVDKEVAWYETRKDGRELVLHALAGMCGGVTASAEPRGDTVVVRVTEAPDPERVCVYALKQHELTVTLAEPLGDRAVVDGKGRPVSDRAPKNWSFPEGGPNGDGAVKGGGGTVTP
ncbi:hypothetical protein GT204_09025 [Streptomyces sp. SID4919]|uniref:hypothetical protein n=1 Tax=unclassified Streptomyces TaxID=2593676 RepID=UPI000823D852|nr:hypothetical protein [Streptomyces sp. AmelKG-E11A]MYY09038.1 hypothetical protein [Streptomyces sp. SID4919]SCK28187.1 hypothetical protein YW7DRAFT_02193 [Streptomyces sp. AmelKG-E11A]